MAPDFSMELDESIQRIIKQLTRTFFDSLPDDGKLVQFQQSWNEFCEVACSQSDKLRLDTLQMVFDLASMVDGISSNFHQMYSELDSVFQEFTFDISKIIDGNMERLSLDDDAGAHPAYIEPSYKWLLANLHNPYPSKEVTEVISNDSKCRIKDISSWFIDARKRIGWNHLCKARFLKKRADIIDAATRFFLKDDPKRPLPPDLELEFAKIQTCAKELYSDKFFQSALAARLDFAARDMIPESKSAQVKSKKCEGEQTARRNRKAARAYPTPERSPEPSSYVASLSSYELANSAPRSGMRKRTASFCDSSGSDSDTVARKNKRARRSDSSQLCTAIPSPAASVEDLPSLSPTQYVFPNDSTCSLPSPSNILKRKRSVSECRESTTYKRLRDSSPFSLTNPLSYPDSLLKDTPFGELIDFKSDFPSLEVDQLDPSRAYQIDVFDFSAYGEGFSSLMQMPTPENSASNTPFMSTAFIDGTGHTWNAGGDDSWLVDYSSLEKLGVHKGTNEGSQLSIQTIVTGISSVSADIGQCHSTAFCSSPNLDLSLLEELPVFDSLAFFDSAGEQHLELDLNPMP